MRLWAAIGAVALVNFALKGSGAALLGRGGPFAQCSEDEHIDPRIAAADPPPPGWWGTGDDDTDATRPLPLPCGQP